MNAFFEMFCLAVNWEVCSTEGLCSKSKSHQPFDIMHRRNNDLVMVIYVVVGGKMDPLQSRVDQRMWRASTEKNHTHENKKLYPHSGKASSWMFRSAEEGFHVQRTEL